MKWASILEDYALLQMLQSYLELNILIRLDVHMEHMLSMIEDELLQFNDKLKASTTLIVSEFHSYLNFQAVHQLGNKNWHQRFENGLGLPKNPPLETCSIRYPGQRCLVQLYHTLEWKHAQCTKRGIWLLFQWQRCCWSGRHDFPNTVFTHPFAM